MFKKEKGKFLKFTNAILLLCLLSTVIVLLTAVINSLLPSGGDYSQFVLNDFLYVVFSAAWNLIVASGTLYFLNNKITLFEASYETPKKLLNLIFLSGLVGMLCLLGVYILSLVFDQMYLSESIEYLLGFVISYGAGLYVVNKYNIFTSENSKGLNYLNALFILICASSVSATLTIIFGIYSSEYIIIDLVRDVLLTAMAALVFGFATYYINKKKTN